jgi:hypothetical protein
VENTQACGLAKFLENAQVCVIKGMVLCKTIELLGSGILTAQEKATEPVSAQQAGSPQHATIDGRQEVTVEAEA